MIKLLIVDDEPLVLVGLKSMLDWNQLGIEICATARNGKQALEIIEKEKPHLVITDIKMPVMTGLELIKECHQKYASEMQFIILTSYEEREYLRTAITFSAIDYLIKVELTTENLSKAVKKAIKIIEKNSNTTTKIESKSSVDSQSFRNSFFARLLTGLIETKEAFLQQKKDLRIDLTYQFYKVCYCKMTSKNENTEKIKLYNDTLQMIQETCSRFCPCILVSIDLQYFAIIFCFQSKENTRQTVFTSFEKISNMIENYFSVILQAASGSLESDAFLISNSYEKAKKTFKYSKMQINKKIENNIIFYEDFEGGNEIDNKNIFFAKVAKYISENIDKRITLNETAVQFNISANYFGQQFASYFSCSFNEYVNHEKIEKAKVLMQKNELKIYEIADKLGFESAFYFSKVFKKQTGFSPREYLENK